MASASVGIRELRQNLSKHLERVKRGETLSVTERGREVAKLVPSIPEDHPLADLARKVPGTVLSTGRLEDIVAELPPTEPRPAGRVDELLADMKRDKL